MSFPAYGTAPIRCGKTKCKWKGYETDLAKVPHKTIKSATQSACPACGCNSYLFMTEREIANWERSKSVNATGSAK
jgi:predicted  nucleic acid-binding Zn-ribbon protein